MANAAADSVFDGSMPQLYDSHLVPLIFESYATDLVNRLASRSLSRVLEIAAGTGVVTRALWSGARRTPCGCHSRTKPLTLSCASSV